MRHEWRGAIIGFVSLIMSLAGVAASAFAQEDGATLFVQAKCGKCHGDTGKGDGSTAQRTKIKLIDWTVPAEMASITDAYMTEIIAKGGKAIGKSARMPRYEHKLTAAQIQHLVVYIRSLAPPVESAAPTSNAPPPADTPPPSSETTASTVPPTPPDAPVTAPPVVTPQPEAAPPLPPPDPEIGAQLFADLKCGKCHGKDGAGTGPLAQRLQLTLLDWRETTAMSQLTDDYLADMIAHGGKLLGKSKFMPLYRHQVDTVGIHHLVAYCRSLAPPDTSLPETAQGESPETPVSKQPLERK